MPATYEPIATTTLGSAASSITFSSIPNTYTDLRVVLTYTRSNAGSMYVALQFNSDTATNYSSTVLYGYGTGLGSSLLTSGTQMFLNDQDPGNGTNPAMATADIFSYAGSTFKTVLATHSADNNGSGGVSRTVGLWRSTSAITSILVKSWSTPTFAIGTTATLYGILKA